MINFLIIPLNIYTFFKQKLGSYFVLFCNCIFPHLVFEMSYYVKNSILWVIF